MRRVAFLGCICDQKLRHDVFSTQVRAWKMNLNNLVFSPSDNNLFCWAFIINVFIYEVLSIHSLSINLAVLSFNRSLACRQHNYTFKSLCHQHFRLMNSKCKISFIASMCVFLSFFLFFLEFNVNIYTCTNSTPDVCNDMFLFCAGCLSTIFYAYNAIYLVYYIW